MSVNAPCGPLTGITRDTHTAYLGIPHARAPYPGRAFEAPQPRPPFTTPFAATVYGPSPAHPHVGHELFPDPVISGDEALNVYAPTRSNGPFPVIVWLYGGGFFTGGNASPWYDGASFARDGVVFVVPNYRVAAEGFMILDDQVANRALLDITAALAWTRDNIAAFGGDPHNVTLAGKSAGATAALVLSGAPKARGLFRRLAVMSAGTPLLAPLERMRQLSRDFADTPDPWEALTTWMRLYARGASRYRGMSARVGNGLTEDASPMAAACTPMKTAFTQLFARAQAEGVARSDVTAIEVLTLVAALPEHAPKGDHSGNHLDIVLRGIRK